MSDLREKIAGAVQAELNRHTTRAYCDTIADAVMEVVEGDQERRRAYTERRVELARKAEAAKWEQRMREQKEEGDAIIAEEDARVRELEAENEKLRGDLSHATAFIFGDGLESFAEVTREGSWTVRSWGTTERHDDQGAALSRAREIGRASCRERV